MSEENKEIKNQETIEKKAPKKKKGKFFETFETVFVALILAVFIRATVAEARYIPSESMVPTLLISDRLVVEKISGYTGTPKRGDILVFYPPIGDDMNDNTPFTRTMLWLGFTSKNAYIKRVVGLPNETIEVKNKKVFINGKPITEDYIKEAPVYDMDPVKISSDEFFMLGDNRNNSMDSHVWGPLPAKNVIGKAVVRFWPPSRIGALN